MRCRRLNSLREKELRQWRDNRISSSSAAARPAGSRAFIIQDSIKRLKLDAKVTVVESTKIPTVGVGEATTAAFHVFLRHFDIDIFEFFRTTEATYKLGIRHEDWRRKGFTYYGPIDDPHQVVKAPPGAPSDYLNVYAVSAGQPGAGHAPVRPAARNRRRRRGRRRPTAA